jgi:hypothetical protein
MGLVHRIFVARAGRIVYEFDSGARMNIILEDAFGSESAVLLA